MRYYYVPIFIWFWFLKNIQSCLFNGGNINPTDIMSLRVSNLGRGRWICMRIHLSHWPLHFTFTSSVKAVHILSSRKFSGYWKWQTYMGTIYHYFLDARAWMSCVSWMWYLTGALKILQFCTKKCNYKGLQSMWQTLCHCEHVFYVWIAIWLSAKA